MISNLFKKFIGSDRVVFQAEGHTEDMPLPMSKKRSIENPQTNLASEAHYPVIRNGKIIRWERVT